MKKNIVKFIIIFSLIFNFSTPKVFSQNLDSLGRLINILGQTSNKLGGEKLEKFLLENHVIIYDYYGPLRNEIELNFNADKTYKLNGIFPHGSRAIHPSSGTWELVGLGNYYVRFNDNQNISYSNNKARFEFLFGEDGNIYEGSEKIYSFRLENKKERINRQAQVAEEKRIAEELRLKKIEEEKRQLAIKREQERIKQEQERIKQEEEKKRIQAEYELAVKKDKERREEEERKELYASIVKYSLLGLFLLIISYLTYKYKSKIFEYKSKIFEYKSKIFLDLKKSFKPVKENLLKTIKDISEKKKTSKKNINPIIEKPIRIKDGITDPMHCQVCEKKTKHYVSLPFPLIVTLAMCFFVVGFILGLLAKCRLTCSKCGNSYISWSL
jgi:flagellar biosynthesis GTPase FlhF